MNAAIYARTATQDQQSIELQIEACKRFAVTSGWHVEPHAVYTDCGFSGNDRSRPGLRRLVEDLKSGTRAVAKVVVADKSRLARDLIQIRFVEHQLQVCGVSIHILEQ